MIRRAENHELLSYAEYAYSLALDLTKSSFPTYCDGIKTKEDFIRIATGEEPGAEVLLFEQERVKGWIHYYRIREENYIGFYAFCVEENVEDAIDAFLEYIGGQYPEDQIDFGFPKENEAAIRHLRKRGFTVGEESAVYVLHLDAYTVREESESVRTVNADNWKLFQSLHDADADMYWNSERLYRAYFSEGRSRWRLFLACQNGEARGNIYYTRDGNMAEIFGIDRKENVFDEATEQALLIRALNEMKAEGAAHVVYFAEQREETVLTELGFQHITDYVLLWNRQR